MAEKDEYSDAMARRFLGENTQVGTVRLLGYIAAFIVVFGGFFWWLDR